jgi:hypothetical protein
MRLFVAAIAALTSFACVPDPPPAHEGEGEGEGEGDVADVGAFFTGVSGLWSGPANETPLGNFPLLNMDVRDVDGRTLFARTDLDDANSLRFSFELEDAGDGPQLVFRNGGLFQGILRDSRTNLRDRDGTSWHFCSIDRGCDYIDATWILDGDDATLQVNVQRAQHLTWLAHRAEERTLATGYPVDHTAVVPGDFPPMSALDVNVTFRALDADADVWVFLSTTACGPTFSCTISRQISAAAAAGSSSASLHFDQLHPGSYKLNVLLDRDRNLASSLGPSTGDGVALPDKNLDVDGPTATATAQIVVDL